MYQIRHAKCGARLFDSQFEVQAMDGPLPDISLKCPRCSREEHKLVLAKFRCRLPRKVAPTPPSQVRCQNLNCLARIADLSLEYTIVDKPEHLTFMCSACKELTWIRVEGVIANLHKPSEN